MKKVLLIHLLFVLFTQAINAQTVKWAKSGGGWAEDLSRKVVTDNEFVYLTGRFQSFANIDGVNPINWGMYIAKYKLNGELVWVKNGESSFAIGTGIAIDKTKNIYQIGTCNGMVVDGINFTPNYANQAHTFLIKYNLSGEVIWTRNFTPLGYGEAISNKVIIDSEENIYITGVFSEKIYFDTFFLESNHTADPGKTYNKDIFISKLNKNGQVIWVKKFGSKGNDIINEISIDKKDNIYLVGNVLGNEAIFDNISIESGGSALFLTKIDKNGNVIWVKNSLNTFSIQNTICIDNLDNVYLATYHSDKLGTTIRLDDYISEPIDSEDNPVNVIIIKMNDNGQLIWGKTLKLKYESKLNMTNDSNNNLLFASSFGDKQIFNISNPNAKQGDVFLAKFNEIGFLQWVKFYGNENLELFTSITMDTYNNIYLSGEYLSKTLTFDNHIITNKSGNGESDFFLIKIEDLTQSVCPSKGVNIFDNATICDDEIYKIQANYNFGGNFLWVKDNQIYKQGVVDNITVNQSGEYRLIINPFTNCSDTSNIIKIDVIENPNPIIQGKQTICEDEITILTVPQNQNYQYSWYKDGAILPNQKSFFLEASLSGTYQVKVINKNLCEEFSPNFKVNKIPAPNDFLPDTLYVCEGQTLEIVPRNLTGNWNFLWSNGSNSNRILVNNEGKYSLQLEQLNCNYLDNVYVSYHSFWAPNVITPNNDGKNDYFRFKTTLSDIQLSIYNRYGKLLYQNNNYQNNWDGGNLPNGVYYYNAQDLKCRKAYKGFIEIIR